MSLAAGDLHHRLRLQQATTVKDAMGTPVAIWADVAMIWAKRTNLLKDTAEAVVSGAEVAQQTVRFDIRPRAIDTTMRLVDTGGVIFDIRSFGLSNDRSELAVIATSAAHTVAGDSDQAISGGNAASPGLGSISGGGA